MAVVINRPLPFLQYLLMNRTPIHLSTYAMATRFELVLYGEEKKLRAAGEEALQEINRLDQQLSFYNPQSEISAINRYAAERAVQVEPRLFQLLSLSVSISEMTGGAFDITVGPLMRAWNFVNQKGGPAQREELRRAREITGIDKILLDKQDYTVRFAETGVEIDLGSIGKGYAIERAIAILTELGVESALLHGGTSTVYGINGPYAEERWEIGLPTELKSNGRESIGLRNSSLSVSTVSGKSFVLDGVDYGHIIDPASGYPVSGAKSAAVYGPEPTICDALSTAVLVRGTTEVIHLFPDYTALHSHLSQ
jgi:FAD:protein FMN transferase